MVHSQFRHSDGQFVQTLGRPAPEVTPEVTPEVAPEVRLMQVMVGEMPRRQLQQVVLRCLFGFRNLATICRQIEKQGQRGLGASFRGSAATACRGGPLGTPYDDLEQIPSHSRNLDLLDEFELFLLGFARPIEIPPQLNIHPEIRRCAEILGEPQRGAWSYSPGACSPVR